MFKATELVGKGDGILSSEPLHYIITKREECLGPDNSNNNYKNILYLQKKGNNHSLHIPYDLMLFQAWPWALSSSSYQLYYSSYQL